MENTIATNTLDKPATIYPVTIQPIPSDATAEQELVALRNFVSVIDPQSYLGVLFTAEMLAWFKKQVRNELSTDLLSEYKEETENVLALRLEVIGLEEATVRMTSQIASQMKALEEAAARIERETLRGFDLTLALNERSISLAANDKKLEEIESLVKDAWFSRRSVDTEELRYIITGR